jgi:hypothetical protein
VNFVEAWELIANGASLGLEGVFAGCEGLDEDFEDRAPPLGVCGVFFVAAQRRQGDAAIDKIAAWVVAVEVAGWLDIGLDEGGDLPPEVAAPRRRNGGAWRSWKVNYRGRFAPFAGRLRGGRTGA